MKMSPPIVPANYTNAPSYEDLVNALAQVRHATSPHPDDYGHHEAAHDIADAVLKRVEAWRQFNAQTPEPLACHVCGSTSEHHFNGCGIAEFCPETGRPIPRETDPPAPEKSVGGIPPGWQLVPKEATVKMIEGARHAEVEGYWAMWDALLAAAPAPPLACHVCGTTSEIHGQFCSVAPLRRSRKMRRPFCYTLYVA